MRGDSLRDLYAKALALLGLGLLGAAGALVDYWPVRGELPSVASVLALPEPLRTLAHPDFSAAPPAVNRATTVSTPRLRQPANTAIVDASLDTIVATDVTDVVNETPEPTPPLAPPSLAVVTAQPDNIPSSRLVLMPPVIVAPEEFLSVPPVAAPSSGDNMFEAAAKVAGRVGVKTGSAIASGFKAVGHAFRFPF